METFGDILGVFLMCAAAAFVWGLAGTICVACAALLTGLICRCVR